MTSAAPAQICGANRLKFVRLRSPPCCAEACRACVSTALRKGRTCASVNAEKPPSRAPASLTLTPGLK